MDWTRIPKLVYDPERAHSNFLPLIQLPHNYYEIVPELQKDSIMKNIYSQAEKFKKSFDIETNLYWDDKRGLYLFELNNMFGAGLFLEEDDTLYDPTNMHDPISTIILISQGLMYLQEVERISEEYMKKK